MKPCNIEELQFDSAVPIIDHASAEHVSHFLRANTRRSKPQRVFFREKSPQQI